MVHEYVSRNDHPGAVDLDPFRDNTVSIYQSADAPAAPSIPTYTFPDVIPTSQPTDQDS